MKLILHISHISSTEEYGYVCDFTTEDSLIVDCGLSRRMAREIAEAYRSLSESTAVYLARTRKATADMREQFADERCGMSQNNVR